MAKITRIWAREILDSRCNPTIEAACQLESGHVAVSSIPSGASTGSHEVFELRDNDEKRYKGKGVLTAVNNINKILGPALSGLDPRDQEGIDNKLIALDATENKSKLGGNSLLAVSEVVTKAGAIASGIPLYSYIGTLAQKAGINVFPKVPIPIFNMINGGLHGAGNLDFQEFFVIPATSKNYLQGLEMGAEVYLSIGENLARRGAIHSVGDEGGYAPNLFTNTDALEVIVDTVKQTTYEVGKDLFLGLDVSASTIFRNGYYQIRDKSSPLNQEMMIEFLKDINDNYGLSILEDPLQEEDWGGWNKLMTILGGQILIVGDDLLVTNPKRVEKAISEKACNAILIKPNQIGTVSETLKVVKRSREAGWKIIVSHRSGETNDWFIADFAVGVGADYVKFGAPCRGERLAKYNRLSGIFIELSRTL